MQEQATRLSAIAYLKWSIRATAVVTFLFILVDIFINNAIGNVELEVGLPIFFKITFANFVPALVTSILTLIIGCLILRDGESIGVKYENTPAFLIAWLVYIVFYFIYIKYCSQLFAGFIFLVFTVILVYTLLKYWVDKINIQKDEGLIKNVTK